MSINTLPTNSTILGELSLALKPYLNNYSNYFNYSGSIAGGSLNTYTILNQAVNLKANVPFLLQVSFQANSTTGTTTVIQCTPTINGVGLTALSSPSAATGISYNFYSFKSTSTIDNPTVNVKMTPNGGQFIGADSGLWTVTIIQ